ncbi:hypothetical protein BGX27_005886, partial [Mortierella sp. AM989]
TACRGSTASLSTGMATSHKRYLDTFSDWGRFSNSLPHATSSVNIMGGSKKTTFDRGKEGNRNRGSISSGKESNRTCVRPRIQESNIYNPQEDRRSSPSSQSSTTQPVCGEHFIQDGDHPDSVLHDAEKRLPHIYRPQGCLSACSDLTSMPPLPPVPLGRAAVSVQNSSLR